MTPETELCFEGLQRSEREGRNPSGGPNGIEPHEPIKTDFIESHTGSQWKVGEEEWRDPCKFSKNRSGCYVKKEM